MTDTGEIPPHPRRIRRQWTNRREVRPRRGAWSGSRAVGRRFALSTFARDWTTRLEGRSGDVLPKASITTSGEGMKGSVG